MQTQDTKKKKLKKQTIHSEQSLSSCRSSIDLVAHSLVTHREIKIHHKHIFSAYEKRK